MGKPPMSEDTATPQRYCPPQSGAIPEAHKRDGKMMRHAACVLAVAFALVPAAAQNAGNPGVPPDMTTPVNADVTCSIIFNYPGSLSAVHKLDVALYLATGQWDRPSRLTLPKN